LAAFFSNAMPLAGHGIYFQYACLKNANDSDRVDQAMLQHSLWVLKKGCGGYFPF